MRLELYRPYPLQERIHKEGARFNVCCWGRQTGKTTYGLNKILDKAWTGRQNGVYWFILQTHSAAKVAFKRAKLMFESCPGALRSKPHETDKIIPLINGADVIFKSGENFEDLRGESLDGCVIDEVRQQDRALWPRIVQPMVTRSKGWVDFLSTPNGYDHFYDLAEYAKYVARTDWKYFAAPSMEAPWWTPEEIQSARENMSPGEFKQEIMAEFVEIAQGKVYVNHGSHNQKTDNPFARPGEIYSPYLPITVGMDFNVGSMAWTLGQVKYDEFYVADEIYLEDSHTEEAAILLADKVKHHQAGVEIIGDATGKARKSSSAGKTDYSIVEEVLSSRGIPYVNRTPSINPAVKDRVNMFNLHLQSSSGKIKFWYNPVTCPILKRDLERVMWRPGNNAVLDQIKDKTLTHMSDSWGYVIHELAEKWETTNSGGLVIV